MFDGTWATMRRRAAVVFGVSSLAVAQPLLDLFGQNPEFFVAGRYSTSQIVLFALVVALVPPLVAIGLVAAATAVSERAGRIVHAAVVTVFTVAFAASLLDTMGVDSTTVVVLAAMVVGAGLTWLVVRTAGGRTFARYLALANVAFLALFLFASPTSALVVGGGDIDQGRVDLPAIEAPVVWIVLDEMPAATILGPDGEINAERYPGFAELASVSTWYRNASSPYNLTHRAVPAQLEGRLADEDDLPVAADHPRNLFTLLGDTVPVDRYESVTDMCPASICDPPPPQSLGQALQDAAVVYGHRVLPAGMRDGLPDIDNSWGAFGREDDTGSTSSGDLIGRAYSKWQGLDADERSPRGQAALLASMTERITAGPGLYFSHIAVPHRPWTLSGSGITTSFLPEQITDPTAPGYDWFTQTEFLLHSMQVGAADALMGELVAHLRSLPTWEDTLVVVTSDHGSNLTPPDMGRMTITDANREEVYRVPLFIKAPGQTEGETSDVSASTLDILPTVIDLLGAETDWDFDGHSLVDGSAAGVDPKVSTSVEPLLEIAARRAEQFDTGGSWRDLAAVGDHADLVGVPVADLDVGTPSTRTASLVDQDLFADLPTAAGTAPLVVAGTLRGGDAPPESELLVAVEGETVGVVGGWRSRGDGWAFDGWVGDAYRDGANDVALYEVTRDAAGTATLHEVATG